MNQADSIRKALAAILRYAYGKHVASDMDSWRSPGRTDFFISTLVNEAAGKGHIGEDYVKNKANELGFTVDADFMAMVETRLRPYGIVLSDEEFTPTDYSVKVPPWKAEAREKRTVRLRARKW
jgi:hypothetical protein